MNQHEAYEGVNDQHTPGEERSFDSFFRTWYGVLCLFANTYLKQQEEARDLVQDCFIKLWENKGKELASLPASYLYATVRNRCIDVLRKRKTITVALLPEELTDISGDEICEMTRLETMRRVYAAIDCLPARMQSVFRLYYLDGKKYSEIASILGIHYDTVRQQKNRALELLKGMVGIGILLLLTGNR